MLANTRIIFSFIVALSALTSAFVPTLHGPSVSQLASSTDNNAVSDSNRKDFLQQACLLGATAASGLVFGQEPALARGFATLEQSYQRYGPRIRAGGAFYQNDLRQLVGRADFKGISNALQEPPSRKKSDLTKPDAGVAERARQAGGFSDARVLVAADLFAGAFSDNSISPKTKKMRASVDQLRGIVEEMQQTARIATGEEKVGGLFGLGAKKPSDAELAKKIRDLYVRGGNSWNEFVLAANEELPLQFDRFEYIK